MPEEADLILTGGVVHTLDAAGTETTAVAVRGGTILAVGTDEEVERLAGGRAARMPLAGSTVVPGLVDSHLHVADIGRMSRLGLLFDARSIAEICDRLKEHLIHAYFPREKAFAVAERLGVAWAVHPDFVRVWGETVRQFVGEKRAAYFTPMRTLLDRGLITGCGADAPIIWPNPWMGIYAAVTRKTQGGRVLGEDQRITVREALRCYTAGSVGVFEQEKERGSIEPGKLADLTVIDRDILSIDPEEIPGTRALKTVVGGKVVYSA